MSARVSRPPLRQAALDRDLQPETNACRLDKPKSSHPCWQLTRVCFICDVKTSVCARAQEQRPEHSMLLMYANLCAVKERCYKQV